MNGTKVCPYAFGFIPQDLDCRLRRWLDKCQGIGWWRRLWREFTGYYVCPYEGFLPCDRCEDVTEKAF